MTITFNCPACQKTYHVADNLEGKTSRCGCGHQFEIPAQAEPTPSVAHLQGPIPPNPIASNPLMGSLPQGLPTANPLAGSVLTGVAPAAQPGQGNTGIPIVVKVGAGLGGVGVLGLLLWLGISFLGGGAETGPAVDFGTVAGTQSGTTGTDLEAGGGDAIKQETKHADPAGHPPQQPLKEPAVMDPQASTGLTDEQTLSSRVDTMPSPNPDDRVEISVDLSDEKQVTAYIKNAMTLCESGEFEEAVTKLTWLADKTNMIAAYELRADAYHLWAMEVSGDRKTEYCNRAIADYTVVMERRPQKSYLAYERAINYGAIGDWDNTIKDLATAIQNTSTEDREALAEMVNMRAYAFGQTGNQQEAERHKKIADGIRSGELKDASSLLFNSFRRYTAEFGNAWFVLSLENDGKYTYFPLGLDYRIKVDKYGNVSGPVFKGNFQLDDRSVVLTGSEGGITKGQLQGADIKMTQSDTDGGKALVGHVFTYCSPAEFIKLAKGQQGGNGNHIKNPNEFFHRFILALNGGDIDTIMEFTYLGLGPNETRDTLQKLGSNPKIRRLWKANGEADPERSLHMLKRMTDSRNILQKSNFDVESLRFFLLKVPEGHDDDLVANIGDKNGLIFTVYFQDVFMTLNGLKMFNIPTLLQKR